MRRRLVVAAIILTCPAAQAASVQTVFSAENALYGAGYNIGQADGWIDDNLRSAVRQYQIDHTALSATGELDTETLAALGVAGGQSQLVGGNVVSSREAARKELGLATITAAKPAPRPKPEPEPVQPVASPEPAEEPQDEQNVIAERAEPETKETAGTVVKASDMNSPASDVSDTVGKNAEEPAERKVAKVSEPVTEPEPVSQPVQVESPAPEPTSEPVVIATIDTNSESVSHEPAPASAPESSSKVVAPEPTSATEPAESSGNVITRMFDFLFGWMV